MKRSLYVLGALAIVGVLSLLYYRYFSITYILNEESFSKKDIVFKKEYSILENENGTLLLLANPEKIGMIFFRKNKYGIRENGHTNSIVENPSNKQIITIGFARETAELSRFEKHIIVAYYIDSKEKFDVGNPSDFDLNVEYIPINDRVLLFAHAVGTNIESLGSDVISYLESVNK